MTIDQILAAFKFYSKQYQREAVQGAVEQREKITPALMIILEDVLHDTEKYASNQSKLFNHIYALHLLAYFKAEQAHDLIIRLASLPDELPHDIFGETITEALAIIFLRTCGGCVEKIKALASNNAANEFCRSAALKAITYAVIEDFLEREAAIEFFVKLLAEQRKPTFFSGALVCSLRDLYPKEAMTQIKRSYDQGIADCTVISYAACEKALKGSSQDESIKALRERLYELQIHNIHDYFSCWACFDQPQNKFSERGVNLSANGKMPKSNQPRKALDKAVGFNDEEYFESHFEQTSDWISDALYFFEQSDDFSQLLEEQQHDAGFLISLFFEYCYSYCLVGPGEIDEEAIAEIMLDVFPRKISAELSVFERFSPAIEAFLTWCETQGVMKNTQELLNYIHELAPEMIDNARDPYSWGMAKSMMMGADFPGFIDEEKDSWFYRNDNHNLIPFRRETPKLGRNEPCACGSGKKYKKCCLAQNETLA